MFFSSPRALLRNALRLLFPLSVLLTVYLYLYPVFGQCAFPLPATSHRPQSSDDAFAAFLETLKLHLPAGISSILPSARTTQANVTGRQSPYAPFRLLALGDPQLEGDTSIPNAHSETSFPHLVRAFRLATFRPTRNSNGEDDSDNDERMILRERVRQLLHDMIDFWFLDIPLTIESARKRVDLFGNDFYLAHIYRIMRWWARPTHVAVLGDLLGSQWVDDEEFAARGRRYWDRVVRGARRVPDGLALYPADEYDLSGYLGAAPLKNLTQDVWADRIINVAGNHDIGYAGDITEDRLARFEREFGKANYELRFELPLDRLSPEAANTTYDPNTNPDSDLLVPELRIVNLNDMNLDTPAASTGLQDQTYAFINAIINTASAVEFLGHFTVVLTHIPLHKPDGVCVDSPHFAFYDEDDAESAGLLREQNLLSADASRGLLQGVFGMHGDPEAPGGGNGRRGVVLNGHDHEGCDTYHFVNQTAPQPLDDKTGEEVDRQWESVRWETAVSEGIVGRAGHPGLREITVRSMMGDFGGNAGLLSAWFHEPTWSWRFEYATCSLGRQHLWWVVHIVDLVTLAAFVAYGALAAVEAATSAAVGVRGRKVTKQVKKENSMRTTTIASNMDVKHS